jgi:hypothetical protein
MEWFAQVDREKVPARNNQLYSYEDAVKDTFIKHCFKGDASDVRLYDAALPDSAIQKLAE